MEVNLKRLDSRNGQAGSTVSSVVKRTVLLALLSLLLIGGACVVYQDKIKKGVDGVLKRIEMADFGTTGEKKDSAASAANTQDKAQSVNGVDVKKQGAEDHSGSALDAVPQKSTSAPAKTGPFSKIAGKVKPILYKYRRLIALIVVLAVLVAVVAFILSAIVSDNPQLAQLFKRFDQTMQDLKSDIVNGPSSQLDQQPLIPIRLQLFIGFLIAFVVPPLAFVVYHAIRYRSQFPAQIKDTMSKFKDAVYGDGMSKEKVFTVLWSLSLLGIIITASWSMELIPPGQYVMIALTLASLIGAAVFQVVVNMSTAVFNEDPPHIFRYSLRHVFAASNPKGSIGSIWFLVSFLSAASSILVTCACEFSAPGVLSAAWATMVFCFTNHWGFYFAVICIPVVLSLVAYFFAPKNSRVYRILRNIKGILGGLLSPLNILFVFVAILATVFVILLGNWGIGLFIFSFFVTTFFVTTGFAYKPPEFGDGGMAGSRKIGAFLLEGKNSRYIGIVVVCFLMITLFTAFLQWDGFLPVLFGFFGYIWAYHRVRNSLHWNDFQHDVTKHDDDEGKLKVIAK